MSAFSSSNWDKYNIRDKDGTHKDTWQGRMAEMRDILRRRRRERFEHYGEWSYGHRTWVGEIIGEVIDSIIGVAYAAAGSSKKYRIQQTQQPPLVLIERYREETYRRLLRKLERAELRIKRSKRNTVLFSVMSACFTVGMLASNIEFGAPALICAGIATMFAYSAREHRKEYNRLQSEKRELLVLSSSSPASLGGATISDYNVQLEKAILRYAYQNQGKVYPELFVIESEFSLAEVEHYLQHAVDKRIATIELDSNGRSVYYFSRLDMSDPYASVEQGIHPT
ncbi:MAG: hypothetical protein RML40_01755 [Bacteroidota bacterium]|nr:hypothetical protein [Candidatus Kapabacteria bacterium]MDW8219234.1 hypothetical protein [Bacteroidota bacterium]